jgi:hypothetical protein
LLIKNPLYRATISSETADKIRIGAKEGLAVPGGKLKRSTVKVLTSE